MSDQPTLTHNQKYKDSGNAYRETLYRSAFAIREELKPGLMQVVELSGAPSVSGMLALLAEDPQACAELLKPVFARLDAARPARPRRKLKVTMTAIVEEMRSGEVSPAELAAAIEKIKADKQAAAGDTQ